MSRPCIHVWGFFDEEGHPKTADGAAVSDVSPYSTHLNVVDNVARHGGDVSNLRVTRTLDGWLVATEFETPPREGADRMWHRIAFANDPWGQVPEAARKAAG